MQGTVAASPTLPNKDLIALRETFLRVTTQGQGAAAGAQGAETRDAADHRAGHRTAPAENDLPPNVTSVEVEGSGSRGWTW